ncbi:hypothetical protein [Pseudomonas sp. TWR2-1-1]|uniref:hypothetical protein n=1 Tax=Pseudomonas sp. TWR2-1-1 TaxID=2804610 RepID=UPI003CECB16E
MNLIKSLFFTVAVLSCTAALAEDGSERSSQAVQKMRLDQAALFNDRDNSQASQPVNTDNTDNKPRAEKTEKSEG